MKEKQVTIKIRQNITKTEHSDITLSHVQITKNNEPLQTADKKNKNKS